MDNHEEYQQLELAWLFSEIFTAGNNESTTRHETEEQEDYKEHEPQAKQ